MNNKKMKPMSLDQVVASKQLKFSKFENKDINVRGWINETDDKAKGVWIKIYSDHSLLYLEVIK
jgi:hypothetical protein